MDKFASLLAYLADLERLSSQETDSFRVLDEVSHALITLAKASSTNDEVLDSCRGFGLPKLNDDNRLGVILRYWYSQHKVHDKNQRAANVEYTCEVGLRPKSPSGSFVSAVYSTEWLKDNEWNQSNLLRTDTQFTAEFVLRFSPPIALHVDLADKFHASYHTCDDLLTQKVYKSYRTVHWGDKTFRMHFDYANLLDDNSLVTVTEIPFAHPKEIASIIETIRSQLIIQTLLDSVLIRNSAIGHDSNAHDSLLVEELLANPDDTVNPPQRLCTLTTFSNQGYLGLSAEFHPSQISFDVVSDFNQVKLSASGDKDLSGFEKSLLTVEDLAVAAIFNGLVE